MPAPSENREMIEGRDARFWHKADLFRAGENFRFFELPWSMEECRKVGTASAKSVASGDRRPASRRGDARTPGAKRGGEY